MGRRIIQSWDLNYEINNDIFQYVFTLVKLDNLVIMT